MRGETLEEFKKISRRRFVREGDVIFHEGDECTYFYSMVFGAVKLSKSLSDGRQHIVELLYPPCFLGQRLESHHSYGAYAASDLELCYYSRSQFENFVARHVELEHKVFEMVVHELSICRDRNLILARKNSLERVASFLLMIVDHIPDIGCGSVGENAANIRLPFTRAEMADYLGLTLETVSRQLSLLRRNQIIGLKSWREVMIFDIKRLAEVASVEFPAEAEDKKPSFRRKILHRFQIMTTADVSSALAG